MYEDLLQFQSERFYTLEVVVEACCRQLLRDQLPQTFSQVMLVPLANESTQEMASFPDSFSVSSLMMK